MCVCVWCGDEGRGPCIECRCAARDWDGGGGAIRHEQGKLEALTRAKYMCDYYRVLALTWHVTSSCNYNYILIKSQKKHTVARQSWTIEWNTSQFHMQQEVTRSDVTHIKVRNCQLASQLRFDLSRLPGAQYMQVAWRKETSIQSEQHVVVWE